MLLIISPAKKQHFDTPNFTEASHIPHFADETTALVKVMREFSPTELSKLMSISEKLGELNFQRYDGYDTRRYTLQNGKQAVFAFQGDVYQGLEAKRFSQADLEFADNHLAILSGLYGVLRPLDVIQPHRLEMSTKLTTEHGKNLYEFWNGKITQYLNHQMEASSSEVLINLASNEYFKAIQPEKLNGRIVKIDFKEKKAGTFKTIGIHAKRARGMMARFIIEKRIDKVDALQSFDLGQYTYNGGLSDTDHLVFTR